MSFLENQKSRRDSCIQISMDAHYTLFGSLLRI